MRRVKVPGLDIEIPPGSAFKIETPPMMPKMHLLAAVVAPRGYGKGVITTNLIEQLKVVDRLILVSPSAASNKALNDRLKQILAPEDMFDNPNDISVLDKNQDRRHRRERTGRLRRVLGQAAQVRASDEEAGQRYAALSDPGRRPHGQF